MYLTMETAKRSGVVTQFIRLFFYHMSFLILIIFFLSRLASPRLFFLLFKSHAIFHLVVAVAVVVIVASQRIHSFTSFRAETKKHWLDKCSEHAKRFFEMAEKSWRKILLMLQFTSYYTQNTWAYTVQNTHCTFIHCKTFCERKREGGHQSKCNDRKCLLYVQCTVYVI